MNGARQQQGRTAPPAPSTPAAPDKKLKILVLHGSRQDGEVFSQRLKTLVKKLKGIADLHFVSAPHTLPLQDGQSIPMRAWWRHWNIGSEQEAVGQDNGDSSSSSSSSSSRTNNGQPGRHSSSHKPTVGEEELPAPLVQQLQHQPSLLHGQARDEEISSMMAAGWEAVVLRDWAVSLQHLTDTWQSAPQGFDGVLGFSNGAAAAFLFAAHAAAHPEMFGSLRFVALAGGYVPEPLDKLLHPSLLACSTTTTTTTTSSSSSSPVQAVSRLKAPLPLPSLHMMGSNDPLIDLDVATQLMDCFQQQGRVQLVHDSGHCVPQQARFMQDILKFVVSFADIPLAPQRSHHARRQQHVPAATAGAAAAAGHGAGMAMEAAVTDIEAKLHRQGLREKVSKGPAKKHILIRMDSSGQPHQHHDHCLSPKASHSHTRTSHQQQSRQQQQQHSSAGSRPSAAVAAAGAVATAAAGPAAAEAAAAAAADVFGEATDMQLEELEALEAIFGSEYSLVSTQPPTCVVRLREPDVEGPAEGEQLPPSALFNLKFRLPKGYPLDEGAQPLIDVEGPLGAHDPARAALQQHLSAVAAEQQQELAGSGGYVWQLVGAAKDWIDANLPPDIATRKAGQLAATEATAASPPLPGPTAAAAAAAPSSGSVPWWEKDEVSLDLVARATAEAAVAHWASWSVSQEDNPWGAEDDAAAAAAPAAATASVAATAVSAEALASAGDSVRGRYDYIVGLVGKPSAGKSTLWNALTDPVREEDAAREGAYPFTTITPNVGRAFIALPDPSPMLGLSPDQVQPAYGFAPGLDINRVQQAGYSNIGPLLTLVRDCGWQQQQQQGADGSPGDGVLWRLVPVVVKDVAGLVPGAYQGRGRGNAFLSDLCDADVLVHVVDASGTTDSKGLAMGAAQTDGEGEQQQQQGAQHQEPDKADAGGEDPIEEVSWVRRELHCWVFDNVRAKWPTVLRRPSRLPGLFSGYHAPTGLVHAVLRAVGIKLDDLAAETAALGPGGLQGGTKEAAGPLSSGGSILASWGEWELHRLVAHFLAARFPILLALNKADLPTAQRNIRAVLSAYPHQAAVAVSAAAERKLHQLRRQGLVAYQDAAATAELAAPQAAAAGGDGDSQHSAAAVQAATAGALQSIQQSVLNVYGTTGCLAALTSAVALKPPRWVFPIADRKRCTALAAAPNRAAGSSSSSSKSRHGGSGGASSLGWGVDAKARAAQGAEAGVLRDCVLMKPGSRVEDVFWVLKRPPYALLEGDFVRAECRVLQQHQPAKMRVVRKDELVGPSNAVLLLQTNRKVSWQHHGATAAASATAKGG